VLLSTALPPYTASSMSYSVESMRGRFGSASNLKVNEKVNE
jgi:hypothetical protein